MAAWCRKCLHFAVTALRLLEIRTNWDGVLKVCDLARRFTLTPDLDLRGKGGCIGALTAVVGHLTQEHPLATRLRILFTAWRAFLILLSLPIAYRRRSLSELLVRLEKRRSCDSLPADKVARIVRRIASLRLFRMRFFPRICLRRALTGFALLSGGRWDPVFVIGVSSTHDGISAHSWIELSGSPLEERRSVEAFSVIYTYPVNVTPGDPDPAQAGLLTAALDGLRSS